tara:strand:+ start:1108 stop:1866 length:759 start_codon:yes stop_codon:yes gene_type:complete
MNEKKWLGVGKDLSDRQVRNFERGKERSLQYVIGPSDDGYLFAPSPNYETASRTKNDIKGIVLHTTEGWDGGIPTLVDPERGASAHFGVERDGTVIQMVLEKDIAWHGGSSANDWTIGIEVAGFTVRPDGYSNAGKIQVGKSIQENIGFSKVQIDSLAKLVADISKRYDIPIDRQHIFGHAHTGSCGNQPRITPSNPYLQGKAGGGSCHYDMGETFNWTEFLKLVKRYRYGNTALLIGIPLVLGAWYLTSRA